MIPEGPKVYTSPKDHLSAYLSTYSSPYPRTSTCDGQEITLGKGDQYLEIKFMFDLAIEHGGKRPPHSILTQILREGLPDYLDFLQKLQADPQLKRVPFIYGSSNTVMSLAAKKHAGFTVEKINDKIIEEDPDFPRATHELFATPNQLIARAPHIEELVRRVNKWKIPNRPDLLASRDTQQPLEISLDQILSQSEIRLNDYVEKTSKSRVRQFFSNFLPRRWR